MRRTPEPYEFTEVQRPTCGAPMPRAEERCARLPGHGYAHRTRYALDNNCRRKMRAASPTATGEGE